MIQPHQDEESWEAKRFREVEEKKLFALHSENQRLLTEQYQFEVVIADYVNKIDSFNQKSRRLEEENQQLKIEVGSLSHKCKKVEDSLNKRNEEYCTLYNYLFTEKRGAIHDAFLKEIDLNNRLNQMQHESDSQIIARLKDTIKSKNQELLKQAQRITELNEALISSSFDYQEKINALKFENSRLQSSSPVQQSQPSAFQDVSQYFYNQKIKSLNNEVELYKSQLQSKKKELSQIKKNVEELEIKDREQTKQITQLNKNLSPFDESVYNVIKQNNSLKEQLENLRAKYSQIPRQYPELMKHPETFDLLQIKEENAVLKNKNNKWQKQKQSHDSELKGLREQLNAALKARYQAEGRLQSLERVADSSISKIEKVILAYVPYYFRVGGLENYKLNKEQQEFITERNVDKNLQATYKKINLQFTEISQTKIKLATVQQENKQHLKRIRQLQEEVRQQVKENKKLSESVECLLGQKKTHQCRISSNQLNEYVDYDQEQSNRIPDQDDEIILQSSYQIKLKVLQKAIQELQNDRSELINIIKDKETTISELLADVKALKNMSNITNINIQPFPISHSKQLLFQEDYHPERQMRNQNQDENLNLTEFREELRKLSSEYKLEKQLIIKEYQQKQALSLSKYLNLLKHFDELTAKYNTLQASITTQAEAEANSEDQNQSSASELQAQIPQHQNHHHQKDQPAISESAIENFTDTLKKYEKEFNKFVAIYEAQIKKSMEGSMISQNGHESEGQSQIQSEEVVDRLQNLLLQHHDTIKHLENVLKEKGQQAELHIRQLENQLKESKEEVANLTTRLEQAQTTISTLKSQTLSEKIGEDFTSSESANTAFLILNAKNKQIDSLKTAMQKLRRSFEEKSKEVAKLRELGMSQSQMQLEQYRLFREIMEEEDLLGVLDAVASHLE